MANGSMPKDGVMRHEAPVHTPGNTTKDVTTEELLAMFERVQRGEVKG
jgi:hypothetical protein